MRKRLVCETSCCNEFVDECGYAYLDVTPELVEVIHKRHAIYKAAQESDANLEEMAFRIPTVEFFDMDFGGEDPLEDEILEMDFSDGWVEVSAKPKDECFKRTACDRMVFCDEEVWFTAYPKHGDFKVSTRGIAIADLDAMVTVYA